MPSPAKSKPAPESATLNVRPFRHRLYVRSYAPPAEIETPAGLIIHKRGREAELETGIRSLILAVGPDCHPDFEPGGWVLIPRYSGTLITNDTVIDPDIGDRIIQEDCVICWIDADEAKKQLGLT